MILAISLYGDTALARRVFLLDYNDMKCQVLVREYVAVLTTWKAFEENQGTPDAVAHANSMMPINVEDGEYVFLDDEPNPTSFKFLQTAHA